MVYIITPVDEFYAHMILIEKKEKWICKGREGFYEPLGMHATMN